MIHRHARINGSGDKRVAHRLHVVAERTDMAESMHLTSHRVGIDVVCVELHRVGMHPQRVLLRVVYKHSTLRSVTITVLLVIEEASCMQLILVFVVYENHVTESFVVAVVVVMIERIARNGLVAVHDGGASEELRAVGTRVKVGVSGVYDTLLRTHRRRSGDVSH